MARNIATSGGAKGTYVLVLHLPGAAWIEAGRLGRVDLPAGYYAYCGSALGHGGLAARVGRHLAGSGRPFWHIDRLRSVSQPVAVWGCTDRCRREHMWARVLGQWPRTQQPIPGFGASDCSCQSHLFYFTREPTLCGFSRRVHCQFPGHPPIQCLYEAR